jgi:hypothetical protein
MIKTQECLRYRRLRWPPLVFDRTGITTERISGEVPYRK